MASQRHRRNNPRGTDKHAPGTPERHWRGALVVLGRVATWAVFAPPRSGLRAWSRMRPVQQLVLGFAAYALIGAALLALPWSQHGRAGFVDHLFTSVSAISTTGLTTLSVSDRYTFAGQVVVLAMFQIGGVGFMTLSSVLILARGRALSEMRMGVLQAGFSVPRYFVMRHFLVHVVVFTGVCEAVGAVLLWWRFGVLGVEHPLWSAVFHSVSAFATAGFSLNNDSMAGFARDWPVNLIIGVLSYLGAIGFIVAQDVWYSVRLRERMVTFTSKVILTMTGAVFIVGTALLYFLEPGVRDMPVGDRLLASAFQVMTASSTAGFNTIPIGAMSSSGLVVIVIAMIIGASPSGTGGGIKTTTVSAILANLWSVLRGRASVVWLGHELPLARVLCAFAASSLYLVGLCIGVLLLCCTERQQFLDIVFEAASAIGTVGLSMGITGALSTAGKLVVIGLMFAGRCGPLTIGLALLRPDQGGTPLRRDDLAV